MSLFRRPRRFRCLLPAVLLGLMIGLAEAQDVTREELQLYGGPMFSQQERQQLQREMREARTLEERRRLQAEHRALMRQRAEARGFDPDGIYGYPMMSPQQRREYHQRMRDLSPQERPRFRQEHRRQMRHQILQRQQGPRGSGGGGPMMGPGGGGRG